MLSVLVGAGWVQSGSNFVLAATVFIAACDVVKEADALGVSRYLSRGDWVQLGRGEVVGSCDSSPCSALTLALPCSSAQAPLCLAGCSHPALHKHQPPSFVTILGAHCQKQMMVSSARKLQRDLISAENSSEHFILSGVTPWAICLRVMSVFRALLT